MLDVRAHRVLASISRVAVLETLRESGGPLGVRELAERMGLHTNTVRKHLDLLVANGFVTRLRDEATRRGRPRFVYAAVPESSPAQTQLRNYRLLASVFAAFLDDADDPQAAAEEAGRRFGARSVGMGGAGRSAALERVVQMLDDIGFQPELAAGGRRSACGTARSTSSPATGRTWSAVSTSA
jgi:predicted ArsR family transcriptional regulator